MPIPRFLLAALLAGLSASPALAQGFEQFASPAFSPEPPGRLAAPADPAASLTLARPPQEEIRDDLPPIGTIDLTTPAGDLWQRIRNGFGMSDLNSPLVADRMAWYLNRPEMLARIIERSRRYLHHIVAEIERRGMPSELALLPMVESAFNPLAASPARALGMWQFIPSTGRNYNLDQNWWRDERRDIIASTSAALDYLQNIYEMHGDWHLALASYNWGEHAVARAVAKNEARGLPTDYAELSMPQETRYYVPKLQALKNIIAAPDLFGFRLDPLPNRAYFGTVALATDMDVAIAAKLAEVPLDEFIALNPSHYRPLMRSDPNSQLVLPADKVQVFLDNLERHEALARPLVSWRTHSLRKGERLEGVAARYGIDVAHLKHLNGITPRLKIAPGMNLLVPGPGAQHSEQLAARLPKLPAEPAAKAKVRAKGSAAGKPATKGTPKAKAQGTPRPIAKGRRR
jgi:membrane-bound lytic murein transglycosylase D